MWIRTQDRKELINSDRKKDIYVYKIIKTTNTRYVIYADELTLGTYTSEDNAIDALAYIQECIYLGKNEMNMPLEKDGELLK